MSTRADAGEAAFWSDAADDVALQRYRTLVNAVDDGIYQLDAGGRFVAVNDVIAEITGYSRERLHGEHASIVLDDEDVDRIEAEVADALESDRELDETFEFNARTADGERIPCELRMNVLIEDGSFQGTVGIVRDVSERRRAERTASEREEQLQRERDLVERILETSPVAIQVFDRDGEITRTNDRARELLGPPENHVENDSASTDTDTPGDATGTDETGSSLPLTDHPVTDALETGEPVYDRIHRVDRREGDHRWLSMNATPVVSDGEIDRVVTTAEDVTALKDRERSLERRRDELAAELEEIYGRITDGFIALDEEYAFTHVNERAEEILGIDEADVLGTELSTAFPDVTETEFEARYREAMRTQEPVSAEAYYPPLDSWFEEHIYPSESGLSIYFRDVTERKRLENELETTLSRISDGFYSLDTDWRFTYANDRAEELIDVADDGLIGKSIWEVFEWGADSKLRTEYERAMETQEATSFEFSYPEPLETWFEIHAYPSETGLSVYFRDITERKERQRKLAESERRYRTLAESFPNGIVTLFDDDLEYTLAAGQAFDVLPVDPADLEGQSVRDAWDDEIGDALEPSFRAVLDGESRSIELEYADREWLIRVVPVTDETDEVFAGMTMAQDVTERKEYERQLRRRERELERHKEYTDDVLDAIDDIFYVVDEDLRFQRWNESVSEVTGYSDGEIESMHPLEFVVPDDRDAIANGIAEIFESGSARVEADVLTKDGDRIPYEFAASALEDSDGNRVLAGIGRNVTERERHRRKLEETIDQLEASNERLEQFAYAASHDLQEPLRMISSYLQLIDRRYGDALDEDGEEFLSFAVDGAERMREMIEGLLAYSRVETRGEPLEPIDLEPVLDGVVDDLQLRIEETDADLTVGELPRVKGDPSQLRQVFQNLLSNALEYSGDEPPRIRIDAERTDSTWTISVHDDGIGIEPEDQERVFEVFQRLHSRAEHPGTGIGLALCQRIIERHGGDIRVDSEPGEGATFSFTLPAAE